MKLISMTDFVLMNVNRISSADHNLEWYRIITLNYANFLKQSLTLGMFVPTDEEGNVLKEPKFPNENRKAYDGLAELFEWELKQYKKAKERVLFEGEFILHDIKDYFIVNIPNKNKESDLDNEHTIWISWNDSKTVESLVPREFELTPTALKQIGL